MEFKKGHYYKKEYSTGEYSIFQFLRCVGDGVQGKVVIPCKYIVSTALYNKNKTWIYTITPKITEITKENIPLEILRYDK